MHHIIEYAHAMGKLVVAEGVETQAQVDILRELACDQVQGHYFSTPLLPQEFEAFYQAHGTSDAPYRYADSILVHR